MGGGGGSWQDLRRPPPPRGQNALGDYLHLSHTALALHNAWRKGRSLITHILLKLGGGDDGGTHPHTI